MMPITELNNETRVESKGDSASSIPPDLEYRTVFIESPNVFSSLFRQIRQGLREPRITVPAEYYRGEAALPVSEMRAWYRDLPSTLKQLPELSHYWLLRAGRRLHLLPKSVE